MIGLYIFDFREGGLWESNQLGLGLGTSEGEGSSTSNSS